MGNVRSGINIYSAKQSIIQRVKAECRFSRVFCELKSRILWVLIFCKWQDFENLEFVNFSLIKKEYEKGSWIKGLNRNTGRSQWKNCCFWFILKKAELTNISCGYFFSCIYFLEIWNFCIPSVYLFLQILFKRKFCLYLILWNQPKLAKFIKKYTR